MDVSLLGFSAPSRRLCGLCPAIVGSFGLFARVLCLGGFICWFGADVQVPSCAIAPQLGDSLDERLHHAQGQLGPLLFGFWRLHEPCGGDIHLKVMAELTCRG